MNVWKGRLPLVVVFLYPLACQLVACAHGSLPPQASITGTATYRERMALPPNAVFEASLEDVSRADAPAEVLGRTRVPSPGNPPIRFTIAYDPARIDATHRYAVRARILAGGNLLFTTDTSYPVLGAGQKNEVDLALRRVGATPATSLENTYWRLTHLGTQAAPAIERPREMHLILQPDTKRAVGSSGCNRFTATYALDGDRLTFAQAAGTMMACMHGMEQERAFLDVLPTVVRWRIEGSTLELLDASGQSVARFERAASAN